MMKVYRAIAGRIRTELQELARVVERATRIWQQAMVSTDDYYVDREIADRETGKPKRIKSLVLWVDELNGEDSARTFSILSQKLAAHFEPFLKEKEYLKYDFIVTQMGEGFYKDWNVQVIKRPEGS